MKVMLVILFCFLAGAFAIIDCKHSRSNVRDEGVDIPLQTITCENDTHCVTVSGLDKYDGSSVKFSYRGCYSAFERMHDHYHNPTCPGGHFGYADVSGDLMCCDTNLCNPASTTPFSAFLLVLSISALFYAFSW